MAARVLRQPQALQMPVYANMDNAPVALDTPNQRRFPVSITHFGSPAQMYSEAERLRSFAGWPVHFLPPENMAKAGFYYTKRRDVVRCPFCHVEVCNWQLEDDPWDDHRKWRSTCRFINNEPGTGNIPIDQEQTSTSSSSPPSPNDSGYDTCGSQEIRGMDVLRGEMAGVIPKTKSPSFPEFASLEKRQESFASWPVSLKIKPQVLSEAGFYYTGKGDQTICYYCGGGLKDWEDSDDPWTEHAKWFSKCTFVILNKGEEFVENAKQSILQQGKHQLVVNAAASTEFQSSSEAAKGGVASVSSGAVPSNEVNIPNSADNSQEGESSDAMLCKLCYNKGLEVVFLPCGHLMSCVDCSLKLSTCGVCRKPITGVVRTYLS